MTIHLITFASTLLKIGGESLDEYYLNTGTLTENTNYINMCRTQIRVRLHDSVDYLDQCIII